MRSYYSEHPTPLLTMADRPVELNVDVDAPQQNQQPQNRNGDARPPQPQVGVCLSVPPIRRLQLSISEQHPVWGCT